MNDIIKKNNAFSIPLILSFFFFLRKGIQYVTLGDPVPLVIVLIFIFFLGIQFNLNRRWFYLISKTWAILIIIWAIARILFAIMNFTTDMFDEYHLQNQFGLFGVLLSITMLFMGVFIFKNSR